MGSQFSGTLSIGSPLFLRVASILNLYILPDQEARDKT